MLHGHSALSFGQCERIAAKLCLCPLQPGASMPFRWPTRSAAKFPDERRLLGVESEEVNDSSGSYAVGWCSGFNGESCPPCGAARPKAGDRFDLPNGRLPVSSPCAEACTSKSSDSSLSPGMRRARGRRSCRKTSPLPGASQRPAVFLRRSTGSITVARACSGESGS